MSGFDERQKGHETKFVMDAAKEFKAEAKRNRLLGLWAAELMGKDAETAEKYALEVILADMEEAGDEDVFRKLRGDLKSPEVEITDEAIRDKMKECMELARTEVYGG